MRRTTGSNRLNVLVSGVKRISNARSSGIDHANSRSARYCDQLSGIATVKIDSSDEAMSKATKNGQTFACPLISKLSSIKKSVARTTIRPSVERSNPVMSTSSG